MMLKKTLNKIHKNAIVFKLIYKAFNLCNGIYLNIQIENSKLNQISGVATLWNLSMWKRLSNIIKSYAY